MCATVNDHVDIVGRLLSAGADVNAKDNGGRTALSIATSAGHNGIVSKLEKAGAKE
jgi:ankyrin repeat protein